MLFCLAMLIVLPANAEPLQSGDHKRSLELDKRTRSYLVHIPKSYDGSKAWPVVLAFHGAGNNGAMMVPYSGLNDKADEAGFIAVYPNGTGRVRTFLTWNAGNCCGFASQNKVDDVALVRALLDDLGTVVRVDPKRIYATGMSNGGMMAYRLGSELSDRIAAIAPVAGSMGAKTCSPLRPVPVIAFHGTDDDFVPFKGAKGEKSISGAEFSLGGTLYRVAWVKADACPEKPRVDTFADKYRDGTTITRKRPLVPDQGWV